MEFPQYRRYKNHQSYFKILSSDKFEEYKCMGKKVEKFSFKAKILPDRNYLQDLLFNYEDYWESIDEQEFNDFLEKSKLK